MHGDSLFNAVLTFLVGFLFIIAKNNASFFSNPHFSFFPIGNNRLKKTMRKYLA